VLALLLQAKGSGRGKSCRPGQDLRGNRPRVRGEKYAAVVVATIEGREV
jgi:hypothetical protein